MKAADPIVWTIKGYQHLVSKYTPPSCRFHPSCSHYTLDAVRIHGPAKGAILGGWRILRCNPFHPGGLDPVPPAGVSLSETVWGNGDCGEP